MSSSQRLFASWIASAATVFAGCQVGAIPDDDDDTSDDGTEEVRCVSHSGDRLRLRVVRADSSAGAGDTAPTLLEGFFDQEFGRNCYVVADGGTYRCLPGDWENAYGTVFFDDAACTTRILSPAPGSPVSATHLVEYGPGPACEATRVFSPITGSVTKTAGQTIYVGGPAACVATTAAAGTYYTLGAQMPTDRFVEMTPSSIAPDTRIDLQALDGSDGSRSCDNVGTTPHDGRLLYDRDNETSCTIHRAADGTERCLPNGPSVISMFSDPSCSNPLDTTYQRSECGEEVPRYTWTADQGSCSWRFKVHAVGGVAPPLYFNGGIENGTCELVPPGEGETRMLVGAEIAPAMFAAVTQEPIDDGGRLQRGKRVLGEELELVARELYDAEIGAWCTFETMADGSVRCAPGSERDFLGGPFIIPQGDFFTDAACTAPIQITGAASSCGGVVEPGKSFVRDYEVRDDMLTDVRVFEVGAPYSGPLYSNASGTCQSIPPNSDRTWFRLAAEVPPTALVEGTRAID